MAAIRLASTFPTPDQIANIEALAVQAGGHITRSEVIRRSVELGLKTDR